MKKIKLFLFAAVLLGSVGLHASNTITYTATAKLPGFYGSLDVGMTIFGPKIVSHTFDNGIGTITFDGNVTKIAEYAFRECDGLTSIEIPKSVTIIKNDAFFNCYGLVDIFIPNSVTTIENHAFYGCSALPFITIPQSVTTIEKWAFTNCYSLTSVKVSWTDGESIPSIDSNVFSEIADHKGPSGAILFIPEGTEELYQQADVWKDFGSIVEYGIITYTATAKLSGYNGSLQVDATTFGPAIIGHEFSNGTGTIICDGDITKIGERAFYKCSGLTSIAIPNSVTTIGDQAFGYCSGLTSITIPNSVKTIGVRAFSYCSGLTSITIPHSVTTIGDDAFYECSGLTSVLIGNSVTTIGEYAFYRCSGLTSVTIGNSVKTIGKEAFDYCSGLNSITIPNSVTTIGDYAFADCEGLTWVTIGNSVTTIGRGAFMLCSGLTSIAIPNSVTTIGDDAFYECSGLTSVAIPHSVKTIGSSAFYGCSDLTSVSIGNSVTTIGTSAFYKCSGLTSVTVFWTDEKSIPSINRNVFEGIAHGSGTAKAELHVPKGTETLYQQTNVWKDFGSIKESDIVEIDDLWYRLLNVRAVNLIVNQDTTTTGERIPYSGDVVIPNTITLHYGNNSIATIEDSAFYNAKLTSLTVLTDFPLPCSEHTFTGQDKSIPLYVLDVPAFQSAKYWKEFTNILFYQPYKEEAKKKVQDVVNGIPPQYASLAKPIADNYFQDIENVNTIRQVDDLTTQALTKLQVFYDQGLWIKSGDYWLLKGKELLK